MAIFAVCSPICSKSRDTVLDNEVVAQRWGWRVANYRQAHEQILSDASADLDLLNAMGGAPNESKETHPLRISVPIIAIGGSSDPVVPPDELQQWESLTMAHFRVHYLPGGHTFFLAPDNESELIRIVNSHLDELLRIG
jgi:surfactin synthase thioesterase subunit